MLITLQALIKLTPTDRRLSMVIIPAVIIMADTPTAGTLLPTTPT